MARMIPDWTDNELEEKITHDGYDGERKLYKELRRLPKNWVVLYDKTLSDGRGENQVDFLVFVPGMGVVNVDAKGGPKEPDKGYHMKQGDLYLGEVRKDVFGQARGAINRFSERVYQLLGISKTVRSSVGGYEPNLWGAFGSLVVFTNKDLVIPQEHESSYLGATNLYTPGCLQSRIEAQLNKHPEGHAAFGRYMDEILSLWTVEDDGRYVSREFVESDERSSMGLSVPQMELLQKAERADALGRILHISGAAGTGKTILACGMARDFSKMGKKVLYVCFNSFLAMQIRSDKRNNFKALHFHAVGDLVGDNLTVWKQIVTNGKKRTVLDRQATFRKIKSVFWSDKKLPKFDVLIVDEAQDLCQAASQNEIAVLLPCLKRKRQIIVFSDKGQSLYSADWDLDVKELGVEDSAVERHTLYMNFRNRQKIFDHFKDYNVTENDDLLSCYQRDGVVEIMKLSVEQLLHRLFSMNDGLRPRDIVILGSAWDDIPNDKTFQIGGRHIVVKRNRTSSGQRDDAVIERWLAHNECSDFVLATTEKQFKGLEANIVIFAVGAANDRQRYVAESRAKYKLYLLV